MIFNSFTYLVFLALAVVLYWILPRILRLVLLLSASVIFYGFWNFYFVPLLFVSILVDYIAAQMIYRTEARSKRQMLLWLSLVTNLSLLGFFKYYYFIADNVIETAQIIGYEWNPSLMIVLLPIGISFYTFQSMSYTIDVYRRQIEPTRDFFLFASYVTFFPQLVAGPILRAGEVIWQLDKRPAFKPDMISYGLARILGGLALKVLLADNIASAVNQGFNADPLQLSVIDVSTLAFLFGFQIYFDFAAYSHIAIGSAWLMGIRFPENFNFPYHASSPQEFWRRWHITLSSWIRDYLYLPLLGLKGGQVSTGGIAQRVDVSTARAFCALFVTWAVMGLWHGADWTFVFWGIWHATIVYGHRIISRRSWSKGLPRSLVLIGTVISTYLIILGWIPFRADGMSNAFAMLSAFIDSSRWLFLGLRENTYLIAALTVFLIAAGPVVWRGFHNFYVKDSIFAQVALWVIIWLLISASLIYLRPLDQFIYFQF